MMPNCFFSLVHLLAYTVILFIVNVVLLKVIVHFLRKREDSKLHVAFFHPHCNDGGGGERVLWCAIKAIQSRYPFAKCYVYTGTPEARHSEILENVLSRFNIELREKPTFVYLRWVDFVSPKIYPFCVLLMQNLGSLILAAEALAKHSPDVLIDTTGFAFTYPFFRFIADCNVVSYTHYPTISKDMLDVVYQRTPAHNNPEYISQNFFLSFMKMVYYYIFELAYKLTGSSAHTAMVNSSWTSAHIRSLWSYCSHIKTVFPPCNIEKFQELPLIPDQEKHMKTIVSVAQFRPEKNIPLQLKAFKRLLELVAKNSANQIRLVLIGGVRNDEDSKRVEELKQLATRLDIQDKVIWKINASFEDLTSELQKGTIGIHTMWNEHFGIGIVESMASGLIMVAHNSGGPKMDIIVPYEGSPVGFLASTEETYASKMKKILDMSDDDKMAIRVAARKSASRFSEEIFEASFLSCVQSHLDPRRSS